MNNQMDEESLSSSDSEVSSEHVDYERDIAPLKRRHKAENSCVSVIPNADLTDLFQIQDEYCIFVRAALALLDEQEFKSAPEDVTEGSGRVMKAGPLKKASFPRGMWKTKYVEIRKGQLSYYSTHPNSPRFLKGKVVPLVANKCEIRAIKLKHLELMRGSGEANYAFEISTCDDTTSYGIVDEANTSLDSSLKKIKWTKRIWLVQSQDERLAWMRAITLNMIGSSRTRSDNYINYAQRGYSRRLGVIPPRSPYKSEIQQFVDCEALFSKALCKSDYLEAFRTMTSLDDNLTIPAEWIRQRMPGTNIYEASSSRNTAQLFTDLSRDRIQINQTCIDGSNDGVERIIGYLANWILKLDNRDSKMTELQAISFSRDALLACNRTRSTGDMFFCLKEFCSNPHLVACCPTSNEALPLDVKVTKIDDKELSTFDKIIGLSEKSAWINCRKSSKKAWTRFYFILSEGVLSYFKEAEPHPHSMQGQINLNGAVTGVNKSILSGGQQISTMEAVEGQKDEDVDDTACNSATKESFSDLTSSNILYIFNKNRSQELHLTFENEDDLTSWEISLRKAIEFCEIENESENERTIKQKLTNSLKNTAEKFKMLRMDLKEEFEDFAERRGKFIMRRSPKSGGDHIQHRRSQSLPPILEMPRETRMTGLKPLEIIKPLSSLCNIQTSISNEVTDVLSTYNTSKSLSRLNSDENLVSLSAERIESNLNTVSTTQSDSDTSHSYILRPPTVRVEVSSIAEYKICTIDPSGDDSSDIWAIVKMRFYQLFLLRGGFHHRIIRGDEVIEMNFQLPTEHG